MEIKNLLLNYKKTSTYWFYLGALMLLLDLLLVGRWEFWYGLGYAFSLLNVALILGHDDSSSDVSTLPGAILATFSALLIVLLDATSGSFVSSVTVAVLNLFILVGVVAFEAGVIKIGLKGKYSKLVLVGAFMFWFIWPANYFYVRVAHGFPLNLETSMYHGGIMLLALFEIVTATGLWKFGSGRTKDDYFGLPLLFFIVAVIGAVLTVGVLGWGLQLVP